MLVSYIAINHSNMTAILLFGLLMVYEKYPLKEKITNNRNFNVHYFCYIPYLIIGDFKVICFLKIFNFP